MLYLPSPCCFVPLDLNNRFRVPCTAGNTPIEDNVLHRSGLKRFLLRFFKEILIKVIRIVNNCGKHDTVRFVSWLSILLRAERRSNAHACTLPLKAPTA